MAEITAQAVKQFRARTGLPLMDCKKALQDAGGDEEMAIESLRKGGEKLALSRADRETAFGRFGISCGADKPVGAIVELQCESAPVTQNEEFILLANDLAEALANHPVATTEELLALPSPSKDGVTLDEQKQDLFNRIREVFKVGRMARLEGATGGYSHNAGTISGVLIRFEGDNGDLARDISMHIAAMRPSVVTVDELDPELVAKEREILTEAVVKEGKPEEIAKKMVEGRLRTGLFAEKVLLQQPYVRENKQTIAQICEQNGMKILEFVHWELG